MEVPLTTICSFTFFYRAWLMIMMNNKTVNDQTRAVWRETPERLLPSLSHDHAASPDIEWGTSASCWGKTALDLHTVDMSPSGTTPDRQTDRQTDRHTVDMSPSGTTPDRHNRHVEHQFKQHTHSYVQRDSKTTPSWGFLTFFRKQFGIFSPNFTCLLNVPICARL